jgi:hypothetical protein
VDAEKKNNGDINNNNNNINLREVTIQSASDFGRQPRKAG